MRFFALYPESLKKIVFTAALVMSMLVLLTGCAYLQDDENHSSNPTTAASQQVESATETDESVDSGESFSKYVILTIPIEKDANKDLIAELNNKYDSVEKTDVDQNYVQLEITQLTALREAEFQMLRIENTFPDLKNKLFLRAADFKVKDSDSYATYKDELTGRVGYIDADDRIVLLANFIGLKRFSEGIAGVKVNYSEWMFLSEDGTFNSSKRYENVGSFNNQLAPVQIDGKWGYIDNNENIVIDFRYSNARSFSEGLAAVQFSGNTDNSLWGYINLAGETVIASMFISANSFSEGKAAVMKDGRGFGYVNQNGEYVIQPKYATANPFSGGVAETSGINRRYEIDSNGNIIAYLGDTYKRYSLPTEKANKFNEDTEAFIAKLLDRLAQKDSEYIINLASNEIKNGYESAGKDEFIHAWGLDNDPIESNIWSELRSIVEIGVLNYENSLLAAPYYYNLLPKDYSYGFGCIVENNVPIFFEPDKESEIIGVYGMEVMAYMHNYVFESSNGECWNTVVLPGGQIGFIDATEIRKVSDFRVTFEYVEEAGCWKMVSLMAGE